MHNMHIMTKKSILNTDLPKFLSQIHDSKKIWDISSFYDYCLSNNYTMSKRTLERELIETGFYSKVVFDVNNLLLKKIIYKEWSKICDSKRYLSLISSISIYDNNVFIFYEDNRGKKYWHGIPKISDESLINSFKMLLTNLNKNLLIWPSDDLIDIYHSIVDKTGSEELEFSETCKALLPMSSFRKILTKKSLNQIDQGFLIY